MTNSAIHPPITVKCLSESSKDWVVYLYHHRDTIKKIAQLFHTSSRTIGRVLEERGLAKPVPRVKGEASRAIETMRKYDVTIGELEPALRAYRDSRVSPRGPQQTLIEPDMTSTPLTSAIASTRVPQPARMQ
jgi:hypothetical protein